MNSNRALACKQLGIQEVLDKIEKGKAGRSLQVWMKTCLANLVELDIQKLERNSFILWHTLFTNIRIMLMHHVQMQLHVFVITLWLRYMKRKVESN